MSCRCQCCNWRVSRGGHTGWRVGTWASSGWRVCSRCVCYRSMSDEVCVPVTSSLEISIYLGNFSSSSIVRASIDVIRCRSVLVGKGSISEVVLKCTNTLIR